MSSVLASSRDGVLIEDLYSDGRMNVSFSSFKPALTVEELRHSMHDSRLERLCVFDKHEQGERGIIRERCVRATQAIKCCTGRQETTPFVSDDLKDRH